MLMPSSGNSWASSWAPTSGAKTSRLANQPSCWRLKPSKNFFHSSRGISRVAIRIPPLHPGRKRFHLRRIHGPGLFEQFADLIVSCLRKVSVPLSNAEKRLGRLPANDLFASHPILLTTLPRRSPHPDPHA